MPRTKAPNRKDAIKNEENLENEFENDNKMAEYKKLFASYLKQLEAEKQSLIDKIEESRNKLHIFFKTDINKTIAQMKEADLVSSSLHSIIRSGSADEGYLTTESSSDFESKTASKVQFSICNNVTGLSVCNNTTTAFKTPAPEFMSRQTAMRMGFVTPKVKPNRPLTVLRRAQHNEMVISMAGSPVLVNSIDVEKPNVNVPLSDGRVISVQPKHNIRKSEIPEIDEPTRKDLLTLRDNLNKIIEHSIGNF